jgi:hypothetical protein
MRTLLPSVAAATILVATSVVGWKAEVAMMLGVGTLPLTKSYSPVEKVRRCVCGAYGCACGRRAWKAYKHGYYEYGWRPYPYYSYGYRWRY